MPGFRVFTQQLTGGAPLAAIHLQVADVSERVDVTDSVAQGQIDPQETEGGVAIEERQVAGVPLNGRSFTGLLAITPGVIPISSAQLNAVVMSGVASTPPSGDLDIGALSVSGQRETPNAFRVNGSDVQEDVNMGVAVIPTLDSVAELKVLTDDFDARLGNQSGGQIQVTTRSGTDRLHGSLYNYFRNTALDARNYFSLQRAPFHQNQFGGTLGGPVPRTGWNFFIDYQGTRQTEGIDTGEIGVPSLAERTGNFSHTLASFIGSNGQPNTVNQLLTLNPDEQSVVFPNAPKGILFPGDPGVPRTLSPTRYTNFAPRLAGSWAPKALRGNTVFRAGYGIDYSAFEGLSAGIMSGNPPYGVTQTLPAPTLFSTPFWKPPTARAWDSGSRCRTSRSAPRSSIP